MLNPENLDYTRKRQDELPQIGDNRNVTPGAAKIYSAVFVLFI